MVEDDEQRKNATVTHTILPHSFFYPLSNFQYLTIAPAPPPLENPSPYSLLFFAEHPVKLASTLRSQRCNKRNNDFAKSPSVSIVYEEQR